MGEFSKEAAALLEEHGYPSDKEELGKCSDDRLVDLEEMTGDLLTYYATDDVEPDSPKLKPYYEILDYLAYEVE